MFEHANLKNGLNELNTVFTLSVGTFKSSSNSVKSGTQDLFFICYFQKRSLFIVFSPGSEYEYT